MIIFVTCVIYVSNYHARLYKILTNQPTNQLSPGNRFFLEKLTGSQLVKKNSPHFMEPKGSLPHSQEPTTFRFGSSSCSANQFTSPEMLRKSRAWKVLETLDKVLLIVVTAIRYFSSWLYYSCKLFSRVINYFL